MLHLCSPNFLWTSKLDNIYAEAWINSMLIMWKTLFAVHHTNCGMQTKIYAIEIYFHVHMQTEAWQTKFFFFFFYLCLCWTYHWLRQSDMLLLRHTHNSTLHVQPPVKELHISCKCLPVNIPFSRGFDHVHNCTHTTATGHMDFTMLLYKVLCTYCFAKIKFDWFLNEWQQILSFFIYTFEFSCAVSAVTTCVA